jgi:hypothetical protein
MTDAPRKIFIGIIPRGAELHDFGENIAGRMLAEADATLDAERERRAREAERARLATLQAATARGKLKRVLRMIWRGHRRLPQ